MKILFNAKFILALIFLFGALLRFFALGDIPGSLNWDEVSWGYNAYSVAESGQDEHGRSFPLSFEAFGDYKQPVYVYLSTVPVKIFDLSPFSTRFVSATAGTLSILVIYFLDLELFWNEKLRKRIGLVAAFLFAISPWSIVFSRVAYEANVGLLFVLLGVYLFLLSIRKKSTPLLFLSIIPLAISSFTYHSLKIFTPIFTFVLAVYAYRYSSFKKIIILSFLIIYALVNLIWVVDMRSTARGRSVLVFAQSEEVLKTSLEQMDYDAKKGDPLRLLHNRRIVYAQKYLENYLLHFDPSYLIVKGDNPRHHAPGVGLVYLVNFFFMFAGLYFAFRKHRKTFYLLGSWIIFAPVASSLAIDAPNASRNLIMMPALIILASFGWYGVFRYAFEKQLKILRFLVPLLLVVNFVYFAHQYFVHTNTHTLEYWQDGYEDAVLFASDLDSSDKKVFFAESVEQGYAFYLFYNKLNPKEYISSGGSSRIKTDCFSIENAYFGDCINEFRDGDYYISDKGGLGDVTNNDKYFVLIKKADLDGTGVYLYELSEKIQYD